MQLRGGISAHSLQISCNRLKICSDAYANCSASNAKQIVSAGMNDWQALFSGRCVTVRSTVTAPVPPWIRGPLCMQIATA